MNWISASHVSVNMCAHCSYVKAMKPHLTVADDAEPLESVSSCVSVGLITCFYSVIKVSTSNSLKVEYMLNLSVMIHVMYKGKKSMSLYFQIQQ